MLCGGKRRSIAACLVAFTIVATVACASPIQVEVKRTAPPSPSTALASLDTPEVTSTPTPEPAPSSTPVGTAGATVTAGDVSLLRTPPPLELTIPSINLATSIEDVPSVVAEDGWSWALPEWTAAHHLGTANPGEPGNIVISGHVTVRGEAAVFNQLASVSIGDTIIVTTAQGDFRYVVESTTIVPESDLSVFLQVPYEQLTLMTCVPDGEFKHRLVVRAKPV